MFVPKPIQDRLDTLAESIKNEEGIIAGIDEKLEVENKALVEITARIEHLRDRIGRRMNRIATLTLEANALGFAIEAFNNATASEGAASDIRSLPQSGGWSEQPKDKAEPERATEETEDTTKPLGDTASIILMEITQTPGTAIDVAARLGLTTSNVAGRLSELKKRGLAVNQAGLWNAVTP